MCTRVHLVEIMDPGKFRGRGNNQLLYLDGYLFFVFELIDLDGLIDTFIA